MIVAAFVLWLVAEVLAFVAVLRAVGPLGTLLLMGLLTVCGYLLLRGEGLELVARFGRYVQHARRTGELPPFPVADTLPRFLAGGLLMLPGFANDVLAILVLLPPLRGWIVGRVQRFVAERHHEALRRKGTIDIEGEVLPERDEPPEPPPPEIGGGRPPWGDAPHSPPRGLPPPSAS